MRITAQAITHHGKIGTVVAWIQALELLALNTYDAIPQDEPRNLANSLSSKGPWTRRVGKNKSTESQIDFLLVSGGITGTAAAQSLIAMKLFRRSDHRLVVGHLKRPAGIVVQKVTWSFTDGLAPSNP